MSLGQRNEAAFSAINLGFEWRKSQTLPALSDASRFVVEVAVAAGLTLDRARSTRLGPELALSTTVANGARLLDPRSTVCQFLLHLQHRLLGGPFEVGVAFGPTLGRAPGAADYRALLRVVFSPEEPVPPPDADDDQTPDDRDMCPSLRGEASEDPMMNGCPAIPSDADGDGIPDTRDTCPRTAGEPSVVRKRHAAQVCRWRRCSAASTESHARAGPDQHLRTVQFETGTALIRDASSALLTQVAHLLQSHPEIQSCEVAGHTDDTGTVELNRELSEARAHAVMSWLIAHGVDGGRLSARGYGQSRPLADNHTEEGRARNRRVEFLISRRGASTPPSEPR